MGRHREVLEFVIKAFSPETLPMARLAEYMADLAALLGEKERVHFVRLDEGSARLVHAVESEAVPKVRARVRAAETGDADPETLRAFTSIDRRLRDDNGSGELREIGKHGAKLLFFPGKERPVEEQYGPFSEQSQLYGIPIAVGGKNNIVPVQIQDGDVTYYCEATRETALEIAACLFRHPVRVFGLGRYFRNVDGTWEMRSFRISQFEKLDSRPLAETVERLRTISRRVGLDRAIVHKLAELRHGPSEA